MQVCGYKDGGILEEIQAIGHIIIQKDYPECSDLNVIRQQVVSRYFKRYSKKKCFHLLFVILIHQ